MRKLFFFLSVFSCVTSAFALELRCTAQSENECRYRTEVALTKMGCAVVEETLGCQFQQEVNGKGEPTKKTVYCSVETSKCEEPKAYLFGGTYCESGAKKISLEKYDDKLSLGFSIGFGPFVKSLCKQL